MGASTIPNTIRVATWTELHEQLYADSWKEPLRRFRSSFAFRGVSSADYSLVTGLSRLGGATEELERHMLRNFRKYARREAVSDDSIWNWLAVAQHHGLPTRLLDWTYSPYVAMHFATERVEEFDVDGVIWCVDYAATNRYLPDRLKQVLAEEGSDVFTAEMLTRAAPTLRDFDALSRDRFVAFLEPPSLDERIVNQFALFSLVSNVRAPLETWLIEHPHCYKRIVLPASLKWEVRDKLDQANITERVLYPGLDGLSRWLKRYYTPKP
ncbi:MAG TPA: FRG domain-containing protein [Vicinamibacterales bacterium]|nr:FRG domain-containing protein [Vicinamibacterales bacterium]